MGLGEPAQWLVSERFRWYGPRPFAVLVNTLDGLMPEVCAKRVGIGRRTITKWRQRHPEFAEDYDLAKEIALGFITEKQVELAMAGDTRLALKAGERLQRYADPEQYGPKVSVEVNVAERATARQNEIIEAAFAVMKSRQEVGDEGATPSES